MQRPWPILSRAVISRCAGDPMFFCKNVLGGEQPWARQAEILLALRDHPRVAVRSGHGVGKTWLAARAALWFLYSHPRSIVLTTAPTQRQVKSLLWAELRRQFHASRVPLGGKMTETRISLDDDWFALGVSTDEPDRFQGYHSAHLLLIMDEATGVPEEIYEAARGVLTGAHARVLLIGNPTRPAGPFYEAFRSSQWHAMHIPCTACQNVTEKRVIYPKLVTAEWVESQAHEWGENSPAYRARVLGEFPDESETRIATIDWLERAHKRAENLPPPGPMRMGVDVARYGPDRTVILLADELALREVHSWSGIGAMETVGRVIHHARERDIPPGRIAIDDAGVGGGVTDRLREQGWNVMAIQAAARADQDIRFLNRRAELYWRLHEALDVRNQNLIAIPRQFPALDEELLAIGYTFNSSGKIQVESKDAVRARLNRSPDIADAFALSFAPSFVPPREPRIIVV